MPVTEDEVFVCIQPIERLVILQIVQHMLHDVDQRHNFTHERNPKSKHRLRILYLLAHPHDVPVLAPIEKERNEPVHTRTVKIVPTYVDQAGIGFLEDVRLQAGQILLPG